MRLQKLDLNLLIMLDILIDEGSVSQTAQRLGMTQPAVSNALARLRAHFDDELFILLDRRMVPTPLCASLADPVKRIMRELNEIAAARAGFDAATTDRTVTVICSDYVFLVFLSRAIRELTTIAPALKVRVLLTSENFGELLRSGRADFGIFPESRVIDGLAWEPLFQDDYSVICWNRHPQLAASITPEQYLSLPHVGASIGSNTPPHIEQESLDRHGIERNIAAYAPNFIGVAEIVVGTSYIATVHTRAAKILEQRMDLHVLRPPVEIDPFRECLQWNPAMQNDPGIMWIKNYLLESAKSMGA
jgi:LysR family transcriptional regulator, nod-box dependent transcriptional activator